MPFTEDRRLLSSNPRPFANAPSFLFLHRSWFDHVIGPHVGNFARPYVDAEPLLSLTVLCPDLDLRVDCVASPALGGVVIGQEVARALPPRADGAPMRAIFVERGATGSLTLRRGFRVEPDEHVTHVEN